MDQPFKDYFEKFNGEIGPMNFPSLTPTLSRVRNSFIPISFQKNCKILLDEGWGAYYHVTYSVLPSNFLVPSFTGTFDNNSSIALAEADRILQQRGKYPYEIQKDNYIYRKTLNINGSVKSVVCDRRGSGAIAAIKVKPNFEADADISKILRGLTISKKWDNQPSAAV
jgi:hypothetical protein